MYEPTGPLLFKPPQGVPVSEGEFMAIVAVSVGAGREAWRWSSSREYTSYLQVGSREGHWDWLVSFETSKPTLSDLIFFNKTTPPNPSQIVPPVGEQIFNYMSLWGPFSTTRGYASKMGGFGILALSWGRS